MKALRFMLVLLAPVLFQSCCNEQVFSFSDEQRRLVLEMEAGDRALLEGNNGTIESEVIRVTNDFLNIRVSYTGPCKDSQEVSWTEFGNGTSFFISSNASGLEMDIIVSIGAVYKEYKIQQQGSDYHLVDQDDASIISEDAVTLLDRVIIKNQEFQDVIQIRESDNSGNISSELIYSRELGILKYSADSILYEYLESS